MLPAMVVMFIIGKQTSVLNNYQSNKVDLLNFSNSVLPNDKVQQTHKPYGPLNSSWPNRDRTNLRLQEFMGS
jgi:hypothetical protein